MVAKMRVSQTVKRQNSCPSGKVIRESLAISSSSIKRLPVLWWVSRGGLPSKSGNANLSRIMACIADHVEIQVAEACAGNSQRTSCQTGLPGVSSWHDFIEGCDPNFSFEVPPLLITRSQSAAIYGSHTRVLVENQRAHRQADKAWRIEIGLAIVARGRAECPHRRNVAPLAMWSCRPLGRIAPAAAPPALWQRSQRQYGWMHRDEVRFAKEAPVITVERRRVRLLRRELPGAGSAPTEPTPRAS